MTGSPPMLRSARCFRRPPSFAPRCCASILATRRPSRRLTALASPTGAYRHTARLALGVLALDAGDFVEAGKELDLVVADPEAPVAEKRSAESLLGLVAANRPAK